MQYIKQYPEEYIQTGLRVVTHHIAFHTVDVVDLIEKAIQL